MMLRRADSETNHYEHTSLMQELQKLEAALSGIICYSEVYTNLASIEEVHSWVRQLRNDVPTHFAHEEQSVLAPVATLGGEWPAFASEMRRQHLELQRQLESFCETAERLEDADDLEQCICDLKQRGEEFTRHMASHMGAEERKLGNILTNA